MVHAPVTAGPDLTLRSFMDDVFLAHRHTAYPVTDSGRVLGLVSFRRVACMPREQWERRRVRDCMVAVEDSLLVRADVELREVPPQLLPTEPRRALVCDSGRLLGLLSITDAARVLEALGAPAASRWSSPRP